MKGGLKIEHKNPSQKYLQIVNQLTDDLNDGTILVDEMLPSITTLSKRIGVSRDTVEKAYKRLKELGLVISIPGKGIFASQGHAEKRILFIVDVLNNHRSRFYDSFARRLGDHYIIDITVHHGSPEVIKSILGRCLEVYSFIAIVPLFSPLILEDINTSLFKLISPNKLLIIDHKSLNVEKNRCIYVNFKADVFKQLNLNLAMVEKYSSITVFSDPLDLRVQEIFEGVSAFCRQHNKESRVVKNLTRDLFRKEELYIVFSDDQLAKFTNITTNLNYRLGIDIGIFSFDDSAFKKMLNISVIHSNSCKMGLNAAELILASRPKVLQSHLEFRDRGSA